MDNAVCTPHLGYVEQERYEAHYGAVVDQILAYAAGAPINVVNPEALSCPSAVKGVEERK